MKGGHIAMTTEEYAVKLAAQWAQELGLPSGNLWEPPISRHVLADLKQWPTMGDRVVLAWRQRLGLPERPPRSPLVCLTPECDRPVDGTRSLCYCAGCLDTKDRTERAPGHFKRKYLDE